MAWGRYAKANIKGGGGINLANKRKEQVYKVSVTLPDGIIKEFRTDELDENTTLDRFNAKYGESNLIVSKISLNM